MSKQDFNILIGVDMSNAENQIRDSIKSCSAKYKLELNAVLGNKSKFFKQIRTIQNLFKNIGKIDIDLGLGAGTKELHDIKNKLTDLGRVDVSEGLDEFTESGKHAEAQMKRLKKAQDDLLKSSSKATKKSKTETTKTGNEFNNQKKIVDADTKEQISVEKNRDHVALDKYTKQAKSKISSLEGVKKGQLTSLSNRLEELPKLLASGDGDKFDKELKNIQKLIEKYHELDKAFKESKQLQDRLGQMNQESANYDHNNKENIAERNKRKNTLDSKVKDVSDLKSKSSMDGLVNPKDFDKIEAKLKELGVIAEHGFIEKLDMDKEMKDIEKEFSKVKSQFDEADRKVRQIRVSTHDWKKEIDNIKQGGFVNESEFAGVRKMMANLRHDSKTYEKDLKAVQTRIERMNAVSAQRKDRQETRDITKGRNDSKLESMRGVVPDSMIDNVKGLNNMVDFSSSKRDLALIEDEMKRISNLQDEIVKAGRDESRIREAIAEHQQTSVKYSDKMSDAVKEVLRQNERQLQDARQRNEIEQEAIQIQSRINALRERGTEISYEEQRAIQQEVQALRQRSQAQRDTESADNDRNNTTQRLKDKFESTSYRATRGFSDLSPEKAEIKQQIQEIERLFDRMADEVGDDFRRTTREIEEAMNRVNRRSRELREEDQRRRGSMGNTLLTAIKKVPLWSAAVGMVYGVINQIKQGFQQILEIDKAMVNLAKVSEAGASQLNAFKESASSMGRELGVVASEVIKATADFQKLGYSLSEATMLGKNSILYANVGDMSVEDAGANIISTVKGFGIEVDAQGNNIRSIVDKFNEVSNNFSISAAGLGEGLKRSSAVMSEAGNTIDETIGLMASANAVIQDPDKVGNGLKTIAMNLRGVVEEGEDAENLVPQLLSTFERLNKEYNLTGENRLKLMEDDGKTFKSTFEIFKSVQKIWTQLSDIERASLVETMGGKHQGVIVSAIINNWKDAGDAAKTAMNSSGSAMREFETYQDGFEYKIGELKNALEQFWTTLINEDAVKDLIDALTAVIDLMTKAVDLIGGGRLLTFIAAVSTLLLGKKLRLAVTTVQTLGGSLMGLGKWALVAARAFGKFIPYISAIMLIGEGLNLVGKLVHADNKAREKKLKLLDDEISKLNELGDKYHELFDENDVNDNEKLDLFGKLQEKGASRTASEEDTFQTMVQDIKTNMPELISYYDEFGNAVIKTANEIKNLRAENAKLKLEKDDEQFKTQMKDTSFKQTNKALANLDSNKSQLESTLGEESLIKTAKEYIENEMEEINDLNYEDVIEEFNNKVNSAFLNLPEEQKQFASTLQAMQQMKTLPTMSTNKNDLLSYLDTFSRNLEDRRKNINTEREKLVDELKLGSDEFNKMFDTAFSLETRKGDYSENELKFLDDMRKSMSENISEFGDDAKEIINNVPEYISDAIQTIDQSGITMDNLIKMNPETSQETIKQIDLIVEELNRLPESAENDLMIDMLDKLRTQHNQVYLDMKNKQLTPFSMEKDVMPTVNEYIDSISDLDSAYRTLSEGEELSLSNTMDLISKHPELIKTLKKEGGVLKLTKESIKELAAIREKEFKSNIDMKIDERKASLDTANQILEDNIKIVKSIESVISAQELAKASLIVKKVESNPLKDENLLSNPNDPISMLNGVLGAKDMTKEKRQREEEYAKAKETLATDASNKEAQAAVDQAKKAVAEIQEEIKQMELLKSQDFTSQLGSITGGNKDDKNKDIQDGYYVVDKYKKSIDWLNRSIEKQQRLQSQSASWSKAYQKSLNDEIYLTNAKKNAIDGEISSLNAQIKAKKIKKTGLITVDSNKEDNKTARLKAAEIQQEIDQAEDRLAELATESETTGARVKELGYSMVQSKIDVFNHNREMLEDDIAYQDYAMGLYDETSQAYRDHAAEKVELLKEQMGYHRDELSLLEEEATKNKDLTDSQKADLQELIRAKREGILEMSNTIQEIQNAIANSDFEETLYKMTSETDKYAKAISDIEDKIKYDLSDEEGFKRDISKEIAYQKEIIALRKGEYADAEKNLKHWKEQLELNKDNKEMVEKITGEIETWETKLKETGNAIKDVNLEIKDTYKQLSEDYVDLYKEQLENMQQAEEKFYDDSIEAQNKAHENKMKLIEKESDALQEAYDKQMQLIDRQESTRTYDNDLTKLQKEASDLKKQIDLLSMDDSYESKTKRADLAKQLSEKELEISEKQHERETELRKNDLEDTLASEQEKIDDKKDKLEEENDKLVESLEKDKETRQKYWENQLNDEKKFAELRKQVLDGNFEEMLTTLETWKADVAGKMSQLGQSVTDNFTAKVQDAIKAITDLNNTKVGSFDSLLKGVEPNGLNGDDKPQAGLPKETELTTADKIAQMKRNSEKWSETTDETERARLSDENKRIGTEVGATYKNGAWYDKDGKLLYTAAPTKVEMYTNAQLEKIKTMKENSEAWKQADDKKKTELAAENEKLGLELGAKKVYGQWLDKDGKPLFDHLTSLDTGGYTGDWEGSGGKVALLHKKELVLNEEQTKHILDTARIVEKIKAIIPSLNLLNNVPTTVAEPVATSAGETNEYNIEVIVQGNADKKVADTVADQIVNKIKRTKGGRF